MTTTTKKAMTAAQRNCVLNVAGLPYTGSKGNATTYFLCLEAGWIVAPEGPHALNRYGYPAPPSAVVSLEGARLAGIE